MTIKFIGLLLILPLTSLSQEGFTRKPDFSLGLSFQSQLMGDIGIIYGTTLGKEFCPTAIYYGPKVSTEFNFNPNNFIIAPKISYEYHLELIGARLCLIDFTDFHIHDFRLTPEAGIALNGAINLFYGYNIPLTKKPLDEISRSRISLTINFNKAFEK